MTQGQKDREHQHMNINTFVADAFQKHRRATCEVLSEGLSLSKTRHGLQKIFEESSEEIVTSVGGHKYEDISFKFDTVTAVSLSRLRILRILVTEVTCFDKPVKYMRVVKPVVKILMVTCKCIRVGFRGWCTWCVDKLQGFYRVVLVLLADVSTAVLWPDTDSNRIGIKVTLSDLMRASI
ncbi:hypothetical protein ANN_10724 [Periplaneta americana]|uniref:Uncharacterized protein n=1 Tax=Periplaneta americana TaxID=6978 RepID=A0ABQ8T338_PERAM|nr:hypothetical protein ANN_10724 [Periplaneta americana]